jgi:hypothetical protein
MERRSEGQILGLSERDSGGLLVPREEHGPMISPAVVVDLQAVTRVASTSGGTIRPTAAQLLEESRQVA